MFIVAAMIPLSEGAWLKEAVGKSGLSVADYANRVGVSRATLFAWFGRPVIGADVDVLLRIIELHGWDKKGSLKRQWEEEKIQNPEVREPMWDALWRQKLMNHIRWKVDDRWRQEMEAQDRMSPPSLLDNNTRVVSLRRIPFFDVKIPASGWLDSGEARTADEADGWTSVGSDVPGDAFALRIFGDCMEPDFPSGAVIIFVPVRPGDHGAQFEPGKAYYFEHSDGKATFKKVFYEPPKQRYRLEPVNPKHRPIYVPEQMLGRMSRAVRMVVEIK